MMCWNEQPEKRPSFSDIVRMVDNRISVIAGYLDVGYNPFISPSQDGEQEKIGETHGCNWEEPAPLPAAVGGNSEKPKSPVKPCKKRPVIQINDDPNPVVDEGHYY